MVDVESRRIGRHVLQCLTHHQQKRCFFTDNCERMQGGLLGSSKSRWMDTANICKHDQHSVARSGSEILTYCQWIGLSFDIYRKTPYLWENVWFPVDFPLNQTIDTVSK